jgi:hypothetical protein
MMNYILQAKVLRRSKHLRLGFENRSVIAAYESSRFLFRNPQKYLNKAEFYCRLRPYGAVNTPQQGFKLSHLMLYGERIAVYSEMHTKHVNKAESYYRLRSYSEENTVLCIYVSWHLVAVCETRTFS